jgi:hypothetical protein
MPLTMQTSPTAKQSRLIDLSHMMPSFAALILAQHVQKLHPRPELVPYHFNYPSQCVLKESACVLFQNDHEVNFKLSTE